MIRLIVRDVLSHARIWFGTLVVTITGGFIAAIAAGFIETSLHTHGVLQQALSAIGGIVIAFGALAVASVVGSTAQLTVSLQRRSYALWQLVGIQPRAVSGIVRTQLLLVGAVGGLIGAPLSLPVFDRFMESVSGAWSAVGHATPHQSIISVGIAVVVIPLVTMLGGGRGAKLAGRTAPIEALRDSEPRLAGLSVVRIVMLALTAGGAIALGIALNKNLDTQAFGTVGLYFVILTIVALSTAGPLLFPAVLRLWTSIVPKRVSAAWYLARTSANHRLRRSSAAVGPLMVAIGLLGGFYTFQSVLNAAASQNPNAEPVTMSTESVVLMLGGPILLSLVGAAATVFMSGQSREREQALIQSAGSTRATVLRAAFGEAIAYGVTATLIGAAVPVITGGIMALRLGLSSYTIPVGPMAIAATAGGVLILLATLVPTLMALPRPVTRTLSVE